LKRRQLGNANDELGEHTHISLAPVVDLACARREIVEPRGAKLGEQAHTSKPKIAAGRTAGAGSTCQEGNGDGGGVERAGCLGEKEVGELRRRVAAARWGGTAAGERRGGEI
jgi:hypothetical protein